MVQVRVVAEMRFGTHAVGKYECMRVRLWAHACVRMHVRVRVRQVEDKDYERSVYNAAHEN